jgi:hypothetical protein
MKMNTIPAYFIRFLLAMVMVSALTGCRSERVIAGALEECSATKASMRYHEFDGVKEYKLSAREKNRIIQIEIETVSGSLDIYIAQEDGKKAAALYEGNNVPTSSFTVAVPAEGTCTVRLEAKHHKGSYCFQISGNETDEARSARLAKYQFALQQIAFEHVYPDGTDTGFDNAYGFIEDNQFAICDVNGDGADELLVHFITAPMAGNAETVYSFQKEDGTLKKLLTASSNLTYYAGGIIKEDWSHGSELAGEGYWPYTLYQYDAAEGCYQEIAQVNMWSKAVDAVDFKGDPYPDDIDAEGAGTVFILSRQGAVETISQSDYEKWLASTLDLSSKQDIAYQALNEGNLKAVTLSFEKQTQRDTP